MHKTRFYAPKENEKTVSEMADLAVFEKSGMSFDLMVVSKYTRTNINIIVHHIDSILR